MEKIYGMQKLVGCQLFLSGLLFFPVMSGTPTFCQMGVLNSCFQNPSESSGADILRDQQFTIKLISSLGLIINEKKSDLIPAQNFVFIGMEFLTPKNIV